MRLRPVAVLLESLHSFCQSVIRLRPVAVVLPVFAFPLLGKPGTHFVNLFSLRLILYASSVIGCTILEFSKFNFLLAHCGLNYLVLPL